MDISKRRGHPHNAAWRKSRGFRRSARESSYHTQPPAAITNTFDTYSCFVVVVTVRMYSSCVCVSPERPSVFVICTKPILTVRTWYKNFANVKNYDTYNAYNCSLCYAAGSRRSSETGGWVGFWTTMPVLRKYYCCCCTVGYVVRDKKKKWRIVKN